MGKCLYHHLHNLRVNMSNTTRSSDNKVLGCWGAIRTFAQYTTQVSQIHDTNPEPITH